MWLRKHLGVRCWCALRLLALSCLQIKKTHFASTKIESRFHGHNPNQPAATELVFRIKRRYLVTLIWQELWVISSDLAQPHLVSTQTPPCRPNLQSHHELSTHNYTHHETNRPKRDPLGYESHIQAKIYNPGEAISCAARYRDISGPAACKTKFSP